MFDAEKADAVLAFIAEGGSLREACSEQGLKHSTVLGWVVDNREGFADRYARACAMRTDLWAEDLTLISDGDGDPQRDRLRVDTRKWLLSKLRPDRYGDRTKVEHSGGLKIDRLHDLTDDELASIAAGKLPE